MRSVLLVAFALLALGAVVSVDALGMRDRRVEAEVNPMDGYAVQQAAIEKSLASRSPLLAEPVTLTAAGPIDSLLSMNSQAVPKRKKKKHAKKKPAKKKAKKPAKKKAKKPTKKPGSTPASKPPTSPPKPPTPAPKPPTPVPAPPAAEALCAATPDTDSILNGLNNLRATAAPYPDGTPRGPPLQYSGALTRAAKQHLNGLIAERTLKHYGDLATIVSQWGALGENIAYAFDGVVNMPNEWYSEVNNMAPINDPNHYGHRQNLMSPTHKYIGIAVGVGPAPFGGTGDATYAVTIFSDKPTVGTGILTTAC